jgi:prolyl-tRNA synthetase
VILNLSPNDEEISKAAETVYQGLQKQGLDILLDDRDERPGVKFKDADLVGVPFRVTVGKGFVKDGTVEVRARRDGQTVTLPLPEVVVYLAERISREIAALTK